HPRPTQVRPRPATRPRRRPALQLGLHAHRRARLEHQVLVRDHDAPQGRPTRLRTHGVQTVPRHRHPYPRHDPHPGPVHPRAPGRLHRQPRPVLHRLGHHRTNPVRLRITTTTSVTSATAASPRRRPRTPNIDKPQPRLDQTGHRRAWHGPDHPHHHNRGGPTSRPPARPRRRQPTQQPTSLT